MDNQISRKLRTEGQTRAIKNYPPMMSVLSRKQIPKTIGNDQLEPFLSQPTGIAGTSVQPRKHGETVHPTFLERTGSKVKKIDRIE